MTSGRKTGSVPADSSVLASRPERLSEIRTDIVDLEVFALPTNTDLVWIGGEGTSGVPGGECGVSLAAGDSYRFGNVSLYDVWMSVIVDGEGVTWIAK